MTRVYKGISYERMDLKTSAMAKCKYDGGVVGGVIFESRSGKFGTAFQWFETFEAAADHQRAISREAYEACKRKTDAYEAALKETQA